jgi:GNAT superfamily N-acetyltransferase
MADVSVRPAQAADAAALADVQVAAWRAGYAGVLPEATLDAITEQQAGFAERWLAATTAPPSPVYRVLVGCAGSDVVAGLASGPAGDEDVNPAVVVEVYTFVVDPAHRRQGHGSRLLAAGVDLMRRDGFVSATSWLDTDDTATHALFSAAGWGPDGSTRRLDLEGDGSVVIGQVRLHTDLREAGP